ncbi:beta-lactamase/transpeptidase-like protein [Plenodomus tracheiphilus IPT5]|uniref:Beta-lactamase/transpeptidase-like protein n=1 Tax=Plenodomus tracheiphilus IPT5 TaxID=1408161 RepID=A0A6A7BIW6_9PLEO|nr:beta-lactamase/transpeptidase-like protein [Plenodomus tracheiphilus IPT5]
MVLIYTILLAGLVSSKCFEPTTAHPQPVYDVHDSLLEDAFAYIDTALKAAVGRPEYAHTSFSVEVTSSKESLWSLHHTARLRNFSRPDVAEVNGDALYRIASITKTFTVLGILQQHEAGNLSLDDTVNKYIKELPEKSEGGIPWHDITLRSLASQLSGIPREFAQGDLINEPLDPVSVGLPPMTREGLPKCDEYSPNYNTPCTAKDLLHDISSKPPLFAPNQKSTYSNVAFNLLGLVLSRVTNQTYETYITNAIFAPLNMSKSTLSLPPDSAGVIPTNPHYWDVDAGIQNPTGGIYSSSTDLSAYLRYILTHFNALTHAVNWIHPVSPSRGLNSFYGLPWEVFQTDRILAASQRTVQFVTKGGGLPGYTSIIMTIPEYDLGLTILVAGPSGIFNTIRETVTVALVRAAEAIAIRQLEERYAGTYTSGDVSLNSSITLVADSRGLVISSLISNGTDLFTTELARSGTPEKWYAALVPTLLFHDSEKQRGEEWRFVVAEERGAAAGAVWDDFCLEDLDGPIYAGVPLNEVIFWGDGKVELPGFRITLSREEKGGQRSREEEHEILEL